MSKRDYDLLLKAGNKAQMEKLTLHRCKIKGAWDCITLNELNELLKKEYKELQDEFKHYIITDYEDDQYKRIRSEAADVSNFAHMIIEKCDTLLGNI